eukprot:422905-Pelagomonas_calceolata.AAC.7
MQAARCALQPWQALPAWGTVVEHMFAWGTFAEDMDAMEHDCRKHACIGHDCREHACTGHVAENTHGRSVPHT